VTSKSLAHAHRNGKGERGAVFEGHPSGPASPTAALSRGVQWHVSMIRGLVIWPSTISISMTAENAVSGGRSAAISRMPSAVTILAAAKVPWVPQPTRTTMRLAASKGLRRKLMTAKSRTVFPVRHLLGEHPVVADPDHVGPVLIELERVRHRDPPIDLFVEVVGVGTADDDQVAVGVTAARERARPNDPRSRHAKDAPQILRHDDRGHGVAFVEGGQWCVVTWPVGLRHDDVGLAAEPPYAPGRAGRLPSLVNPCEDGAEQDVEKRR
jgi:hypothetical protein